LYSSLKINMGIEKCDQRKSETNWGRTFVDCPHSSTRRLLQGPSFGEQFDNN
jgi:hypothetical protein